MKKGLFIDGVKTDPMKVASSKEGRKIYTKTEIKLRAFLTRGGAATKLSDLWVVQEMYHKGSSSLCNRKKKKLMNMKCHLFCLQEVYY